MKLVLTPFKFPSGKNISCYECFNGSIDLEVTGGVGPYSYSWADDITTQDRSGLGAMQYDVQVTDANTCREKNAVKLEQPEKATWGMGGNANTDPNAHYIGTSDNADVVIKANGQEALRVKANGEIGLFGNSTEEGPLFRLEDGTLGLGDFPDAPTDPERCFYLQGFQRFWLTTGNDFTNLCPLSERPKIGTLDNTALRIITNNTDRIHVGTDGKVGIGTTPTNSPDYRLFVENDIACRDVLVKLGAWPDFVFQPNYGLMPLSELRDYLSQNQHLPGIPSAKELEAKDGVDVGEMQRRMLQVVEEQALYILELEEKYGELEKRLVTLEQKQH
ncbi:MAG: SprB repeat-containing protein [Flavobacteriales bacterium]|nr:SprB repeat-containing protein [Flavobacteriales bacterium]